MQIIATFKSAFCIGIKFLFGYEGPKGIYPVIYTNCTSATTEVTATEEHTNHADKYTNLFRYLLGVIFSYFKMSYLYLSDALVPQGKANVEKDH